MTLSDCVLELTRIPTRNAGSSSMVAHAVSSTLPASEIRAREVVAKPRRRKSREGSAFAGWTTRRRAPPRPPCGGGGDPAGVSLFCGSSHAIIILTMDSYQNRQLLLVSSGSSRRSPHPAPSGLKICIQTPAPVCPPRCPRRHAHSACRLRGGPGSSESMMLRRRAPPATAA